MIDVCTCNNLVLYVSFNLLSSHECITFLVIVIWIWFFSFPLTSRIALLVRLHMGLIYILIVDDWR